MTLRERRLAHRITSRGDEDLIEALLEMKGIVFGSRFRCESLYDIGGEGAVFVVTDRVSPSAPRRVAKVPLLPFNRPYEMTQAIIAERREVIALEASYLAHTGAKCLPKHLGTYDFQNPLIDPARGGVFRELDPVVVMEKLSGQDLDRWLARVHRSHVPLELLRLTLDRVTVWLLRALVDLLDRGLLYVDLRPGNLRMIRQPKRHIRLLDAGSLVPTYDQSGRFPHVPAYLPPETLDAIERGERVLPTPAIQAVMCGRTLYEIATGNVPRSGEPIDESALTNARVSAPVAEAVRQLASGEYERVHDALAYLKEHARGAAAREPVAAKRPAPTKAPGSARVWALLRRGWRKSRELVARLFARERAPDPGEVCDGAPVEAPLPRDGPERSRARGRVRV